MEQMNIELVLKIEGQETYGVHHTVNMDEEFDTQDIVGMAVQIAERLLSDYEEWRKFEEA
jgi:hypothetical protein